jgi:hypothetical protein
LYSLNFWQNSILFFNTDVYLWLELSSSKDLIYLSQ